MFWTGSKARDADIFRSGFYPAGKITESTKEPLSKERLSEIHQAVKF